MNCCERCGQPFRLYDSIEPTATQFGLTGRLLPSFRHLLLEVCVERLAELVNEFVNKK